MPGIIEIVIVVLISAIPWLLAAWFIRYLIEMSRERRRLRLEVSKLAHELEGIRSASTSRADTVEESGA